MNEINQIQERKKANKKRSKKLTYLKLKNMELSKKIEQYIENNQLEPETKEFAQKLCSSLQKCSHHSLYATSGNEIELISSITCNHKICNICNWTRQKKIRRKYFKWFSDNQFLVELSKHRDLKVTTISQVEKYQKKGYEIEDYVEYDLMHLTLTVPHTVNGWKNKKFYFDEIKTAFNYMRKTEEWSQLVYGGEYGVESTRNEKGFHIHIHALLFVKQLNQNRNLLHKEILRIWNRLTAWDGSERKELTEKHIESIKRSNRLFDDKFVTSLNPTGSTIINLETIYRVDKTNNSKVRSFEFNSEAMIFAVMETISYHFAPKMFALTESLIDIENIIEILPAVYRQTLYYKFGCLHGESSLNVKDDSLLEDFEETASFDDETGEVYERQFFITNPANMFHDSNGKIRLKKTKERFLTHIPAKSGREAIDILQQIAYNH